MAISHQIIQSSSHFTKWVWIFLAKMIPGGKGAIHIHDYFIYMDYSKILELTASVQYFLFYNPDSWPHPLLLHKPVSNIFFSHLPKVKLVRQRGLKLCVVFPTIITLIWDVAFIALHQKLIFSSLTRMKTHSIFFILSLSLSLAKWWRIFWIYSSNIFLPIYFQELFQVCMHI